MRGRVSHIPLQRPKCPSMGFKGEREQSSRSPLKPLWAEQNDDK